MYSRNLPSILASSYDAAAPFSDPFADLAAMAMPMSVPAMLRHGEYFSIADGTLRAAYNRAASYFLTDLKVTGELGEDERKKQKTYLKDRAGLMEFAHEAGLSLLTYGNQYTSVFHPLVRYVVCPGKYANGAPCGSQWRFNEFRTQSCFQYTWSAGIRGRCPTCGFYGLFHGKDTRPPRDTFDESRPLVLKSWNPHDIRLVYNSATGQTCAYDWIIPADDRTEMRTGSNPYMLEDTPWDWLMAGVTDMNVRFTPDYVHHWREPYLAGLRFRGVGVPRAIVNYRQLYYTKILSRMNEVLALGHVVPMRVISPANTAGRSDESDILRVGHLGNMRQRIMQFVANWRHDPSSVQFSPIPLQMQALGADARQLIPADIINQAYETELNAVDMPAEFYRMTMTTQNAPVGLRMFRRMWGPYVYGLNRMIQFVGRRAQYLLKWEKADYQLDEVSLVDDIENQQLKVQMAQANLLSRSAALKQVGEDFEEQAREKLQEQRTEGRIQAEFQEESDAFGFAQQLANAQAPPAGAMPPGGQPGQPQPGGAPPEGGGQGAPAGGQPQQVDPATGQPIVDPIASLVPTPGQPLDPQEMASRAQQLAEFLLSRSEGERVGLLKRVREANEPFHSVLKGVLEKLRSQDRSKGQQMLAQQRQSGG